MRTMLEERDKRQTKANEQIRNLNDELSDVYQKLQEKIAEETSNKKTCCARFQRLFGR